MSITPAMKHFLSAEKYAVLGRVMTDPSRWDYKVHKWYKDRGLEVTPVKYGEGDGEMLSDPSQIPNLSETSISIIINPKIGISILKSLYPTTTSSDSAGSTGSTGSTSLREAELVSPRSVWFQPGAEDSHIINYIKENGLEDKVIWGRCVLVDGDKGRREVGRL